MTDSTDVALVTGATSGIGLEIAGLLAERGYNLFLVARSGERLDQISHDLQRRHNMVIHYLVKDLSLANAPEDVENETKALQLHVDILVNNAGFGLLGPFAGSDRSDQLEMIRLNVVSLFELTHRFLGPMVARGRGGILNVASTAGFLPGPLMSGYFASKAFVLSFSEALTRELRDTGVSVTALCPGSVKTGFQHRAGINEGKLPSAMVVDARSVARAGIDGLLAGKPIVIPGMLNRILTTLVQIAPRRLIRDATFRVQSARLASGE